MKIQNRISAVAGAIWLAVILATPALLAQPATSSNRFLFIIDTSAAMKPLEMPQRETVFDLIYSGARGRMTNGDTYGVWLVNDQNDTSFQMESWRQKHNVEMAAKAVAHLKDHGLKGPARLDAALADARRVIQNVDDLTVILVSNGETPITGTPFDEAINARFAELAPAMKRAKATLNTALVAQNGEFVAWAVNSPEFLIEIPSVEPRPKRVKVELVVAKTNAPALPAAAATPVAPPITAIEKPRVALAPIIITKESVAQERRSYVSSTMTGAEPAPAVVPLTNSVPAPVAASVTNTVAVVVTNTSNVAAAPSVVVPSKPAPAMAVVPPPKPEPTNTPSAAVSAPTPAALPAKLPKPAATSRPLLWVITGASVALALVFGVMLMLRGRGPEASLISQSLTRERSHVS